MKRFVVEVQDNIDEHNIREALYHGLPNTYHIYPVKETYATADNRPRMTARQRDALWELCGRYNKPFNEKDYVLYEKPSVLSPGVGWVEGWVGGPMYNGHNNMGTTIYVGVSPEGEIHS